MCSSFIFTALLAAMPALTSAQASDGELKGFWRKGDVIDFKTPVHENTSATVVYRDYPATVDEAKLRIQKETAEALKNAQNPQENGQNQAPEQTQPNTPLTREQIIAKYGSPEQPSPVRAQKDSPSEMQGLFAALDSGDKELAWQYSLALARRNTQIQQTVSKATDYQVLAAEALGMRPSQKIEESGEVGAVRMELKELMQKTQMEEAQKKLQSDQLLAAAEGRLTGDEWAQTASKPREPLAPQIPVDPGGKVKLLIFFDERSLNVKDFANSLKPLMEKYKGDQNVSIVGLTMRTYELPGLKKVSSITGFPFPLVNGEALAPELRIQRYPTFVFLALTSKQTYHLEGVRGVDEIEKVLKKMKGPAK
jgi:hypothetical protein